MIPALLLDDTPLGDRLRDLRAMPVDARRTLELAVVAALAQSRDEAAAALDRAAELGAPPGEVAFATAMVALWSGDPVRARVCAEPAPPSTERSIVIAESMLLLGRCSECAAHLADIDDRHPYGRLLRAEAALREMRHEDAFELLDDLPSRGLAGARARRLRAEAWLASSPADPRRARDELSAAAWTLLRIGGLDELGRCYLDMAEVEVATDGSRERAARWLARAHPLLTRAGNRFDLERLRKAFRRHGRRALDRLVDADLERAVEGARARLAHALDLRGAIAASARAGVDRGALEDELAPTLAALSEDQEQLIASLERLLVEHQQSGKLVAITRQLFLLGTDGELDREIPRLALGLGASSATLVQCVGDDCTCVGGTPEEIIPRADIRRALATGNVLHVDVRPDRRLAIVPISASPARALLLRQGGARRSAGDESDERLEVLASVASAAYERARSAQAVHEAAARDAATLDVIHDGILTLDASGALRSMNASAAALLGISREALVGRALGATPGMRALAEAAERGAENEPVSIPRGEVLVRARTYVGGVVVTLQELGRARHLAQKLVGSTARFTFADLVGRDPVLLSAIDDARRVATSDVPILITGETGTGKELLAQAIHNASGRAAHPFVGVNVAAIPRELLESELFGYEPGAFTGARARGQAGRFELADRGTLLLDEIGDMPLDMQAKLLRVLQERVVQPLGSARSLPIRARIIATTHRDLDDGVRDGTFRLDLLHRLRVVHLRLPPLRERRGDVRLLVERQLAAHAQRTGRQVTVAPHVLEALAAHAWPGNVRELANVVEAASTLWPADLETWSDVPAMVKRAEPDAVAPR
ncbi:MAG: sigma 54-interacting transcriptional regulator, partial [Deltaproteobacteria bacterium]|nr:sigma 54-interacting transcriptional regulator [Deltaproteobacteria bacterium]